MPTALKFVQDETPDVFGVFPLEDGTLATTGDSEMVLLPRASTRLPTSPERPRGCFPVYPFNKAGVR